MTLQQLLTIKDQHPEGKVTVGSTEICEPFSRNRSKLPGHSGCGRQTCLFDPCSSPLLLFSAVEMAVRGREYHVFINPSRVPELTALEVTEQGLLVGAARPLSDVGRRMQELVDQLPGGPIWNGSM